VLRRRCRVDIADLGTGDALPNPDQPEPDSPADRARTDLRPATGSNVAMAPICFGFAQELFSPGIGQRFDAVYVEKVDHRSRHLPEDVAGFRCVEHPFVFA
jgi:hypothetical protein